MAQFHSEGGCSNHSPGSMYTFHYMISSCVEASPFPLAEIRLRSDVHAYHPVCLFYKYVSPIQGSSQLDA